MKSLLAEVFIGGEVSKVQCELDTVSPGLDPLSTALVMDGLLEGFEVIKGVVQIEEQNNKQIVYISVLNNSTEPKSNFFTYLLLTYEKLYYNRDSQ